MGSAPHVARITLTSSSSWMVVAVVLGCMKRLCSDLMLTYLAEVIVAVGRDVVRLDDIEGSA